MRDNQMMPIDPHSEPAVTRIPPRSLLIAAAASVITCSTFATAARAQGGNADPVPMIHVTDLFRPHDDPDDHWDLACVYALAYQGCVDLRGILIDYPKPQRDNDPDVLAVAQLNHLTGLAVPVMVGSPRGMAAKDRSLPESPRDLRGVQAMLKIMRDSPAPVVINVLGSCRDVVLACRLDSDLFARKCRAVYLNAGSGTPSPDKARQLEWNVSLDPTAYSAIFDLPCPIYWMPCFQEVHNRPSDMFQVAEYSTFYRFSQDDVLTRLSAGMQRYFAFMFQHGRFVRQAAGQEPPGADWLRALNTPPDSKLMRTVSQMERNMWCSGGFLHAAGRTVTTNGKIVSLKNADDPVFTFDPIEVSCSADAVTRWKRTPTKSNRFIFHVQNIDRYSLAMTTALRTLLEQLP
jgi:hypothetical protein